ncbi:UNVERIFIED_CONTAM: hypothetical protein K2H54_016258 [Gekko kuhli]
MFTHAASVHFDMLVSPCHFPSPFVILVNHAHVHPSQSINLALVTGLKRPSVRLCQAGARGRIQRALTRWLASISTQENRESPASSTPKLPTGYKAGAARNSGIGPSGWVWSDATSTRTTGAASGAEFQAWGGGDRGWGLGTCSQHIARARFKQ